MELWDKDYLDMISPLTSSSRPTLGEFKFGCVACGIDCDLSNEDAEFTF